MKTQTIASTPRRKTTQELPAFRVRRRTEKRWLRNFDTYPEARAFAREHAIAHGCDMVVQSNAVPDPLDEWEF